MALARCRKGRPGNSGSLMQSAWSTDESLSQRGAAFFDTLTARLASVLGADVAFVGQLGLDGTSIDIVSVFGDGKRAKPFSYCLAGTPCAQVIANECTHTART